MIIQKIDSRADYKSSGIKRNKSFRNSLANIQNKNVGTRDFLYHPPIFTKSTISFKGATPDTHPKSFEETMDTYFALPEGQKPDQKQIEAARVIHEGNHAPVVLPTGTGKTLIAEYAIRKNMVDGKGTCFTFPTKALANEKYRALCEKFGKENVGLLTGDIKLNTEAPIKIMIEEVYANAVMGDNQSLKNLATVIHDEFHTMNDPQRGPVYEKAVIFTPPHIQQVFLTGTVGNGQELTDWINSIEAKKVAKLGGNIPIKKAVLVEMPSSERYVPLKHYIYHEATDSLIPLMTEKYNLQQLLDLQKQNLLSERQKEVLSQIGKIVHKEETPEKGLEFLQKVLKTKEQGDLEDLEQILQKELKVELPEAQRLAAFLSDPAERKFNEAQLSKEALKEASKGALSENNSAKLGILKIVEGLQAENKFPAIIFKLSRSGCDKLQKDSLESGLNLLTEEERKKVAEIITEFKKDHYLGVNFDEEAVLRGFTTHHAGMTPDAKELTERLAENKLVKVTYATSTLDRGINFPTRTVVIQEYDRAIGKRKDGNTLYSELSINDLQQEFGRGGRRGGAGDHVGNVVHKADKRHSPFDIYKKVISSADDIVSRLRPEYNFVSQIMVNKGLKGLDDVVDMSFLAMKPERASREIKTLKGEFQKYAKLLLGMNVFDNVGNNLALTPEGSVISKARGVDGLLFSKILFDLPLDSLKPSHLAALACYLSEGGYKDEAATIKGVNIMLPKHGQTKNNKNGKGGAKQAILLDKEMTDFLQELEKTKTSIKLLEMKYAIKGTPKTPNILAMKFIQKWAETPSDEPISSWIKLIKREMGALSEGELFNAVNRAADILKQMSENAEYLVAEIQDEVLNNKMRTILRNSQEAWMIIKKEPIMDVILKAIK